MIPMLAWRNIWRNKARSLVIMCSIALGLFAGIAVLSLYKGMMSSRIRTVIDEELGHMQIHHPLYQQDHETVYHIPDAVRVVRKLREIPEISAVASRSLAQGMLSTPTGSAGVEIRGVVPEMENSFSKLSDRMLEGKGLDGRKNGQLLIGKKLAEKMKLRVGSKLVLTFNDTTNNIMAAAFRIAGIYQSSNSALDERIVYVQKSELNVLLGYADATHQIAIKLHRDEDLELVQNKAKEIMPSLRTESWKELSPETDFMVKSVDDYSYIIMIIIMIALAFGIINTMLMAVMERTREIGMMMALGTGRSLMFALVIMETIFLTLLGAPVGIIVGSLVIQYYNHFGLDLSGMGEDMMASFGFNTMVYPAFPSDKLFAVILIVTVTALLSGLLPAIKALFMRPVDALRN